MAHHFDTGFCVRRPSWHGKETLLMDYPETWDAAREAAGLTWEPVERRLAVEATAADPDVPDLAVRTWTPVTTHKAIVRSDTGFHLGTVGADWTPITHATMGELVEALVAEPNVLIETLISVRDGRQVAATILLDEPYTLPGDDSVTLPYLALLNAHDGSAACKAVATQVRVICANTIQAASLDGDRHGRQFSFRHTSGVMGRIEEAKAAIAGARADAADWVDLATDLAVRPAPPDAVTRFLSEFIPEPPADVVSDRVRANIAAARSAWSMVYEASPTCAANHGTALGVVHASVEYLDHLRAARSHDTIVGRQLLRPEPLKARAVRIVREVCPN